MEPVTMRNWDRVLVERLQNAVEAGAIPPQYNGDVDEFVVDVFLNQTPEDPEEFVEVVDGMLQSPSWPSICEAFQTTFSYNLAALVQS